MFSMAVKVRPHVRCTNAEFAGPRCNGVFGASEHPCRDFVRVPGPAVSSFQSSARGQVVHRQWLPGGELHG